jgi:glucokinase
MSWLPASSSRTAVLNDFEAVGYGILALGPKDVVSLNDVKVKPQVRPFQGALHTLLFTAVTVG